MFAMSVYWQYKNLTCASSVTILNMKDTRTKATINYLTLSNYFGNATACTFLKLGYKVHYV